MNTKSTKAGQPDWDRIAGKFDVFLPQIAPVGEVLLEALAVAPGDRVLDLASGTGEPALTLARRVPQATIVGTDAAEGMVQAACKKAAAAGLANITFEVMPAERLEFADSSFDKVLCRFGVMLFDDPLRGCREMHRVLKPGGAFAFAVWSSPEKMTTMYWAAQAFLGRVPEDLQPPIEKIASLGRPGAMDELLNGAGFTRYEITRCGFDFRFSSFADYWDTIEASEVNRAQWDVLSEPDRHGVREEIAGYAREYETDHGLVIPHEYLLVTGSRP